METEDTSPTNREDLESAWRQRLELKQDAYRTAAAQYGRLTKESSEGHSPDHPGSVVKAARESAAQALREYSRVLRIFTALTVDKKLPEETITHEVASA